MEAMNERNLLLLRIFIFNFLCEHKILSFRTGILERMGMDQKLVASVVNLPQRVFDIHFNLLSDSND